jgi:hypothetical protein
VPEPSGALPDEDDGGDHGASEPWVQCPRRRHARAADPLGPVVAHGAREAPGHRAGALRPSEYAFFRRASLQLDAQGEGFFFSGLSLPAPEPRNADVERLVTLAVRLADLRVLAAPTVTGQRREVERAGDRIVWDIAFVHDGVRLTPGRCELSAAAGQRAPATLSCRVPPGRAPLSFDRFAITDQEAVSRAAQHTRTAARIHDVDRVYWVNGGARGRYHVVHFDGRREYLTVLDASGQVVASGSNEKAFVFDGYDPDYLGGLKRLSAHVGVGDGQSTHLDTASFDATRSSCLSDDPDAGPGYSTGFAVCGNHVLLDDDLQLGQPLVAPRSDEDYTNPANAPTPSPALPPDPLGPQLLLTNQAFGVAPIHGSRNNVTVRPALPSDLAGWPHYLRDDVPAARPMGPAHHAELQAFFLAGKLQRFYGLLDKRFEVFGQDRFRTELTVHWRPVFSTDEPEAGSDFNKARAGRYFFKIADARPTIASQPAPYALDGTSDGSLVAHEYHHHVQESLAKDDGWKLLPNPYGKPDELFPGDCPSKTACRRRVAVLEGLADAFAALEVRRGAVGPLFASTSPLAPLLNACNDKSAYGTGAVGDLTRVLCNKRAFGYWAEKEPVGGDTDACTWSATEAEQFGPYRQLVIGGAAFGYARRFFEAGIASLTPARHLLGAERSLQGTEDGEVRYFDALLKQLRAAPHVETRRYEHAARAASIEKGVFPAVIHAFGAPGPDARPRVRCNVGECSEGAALAVSLATLTLSGPFVWASTAQPPELDVFAVPGDRYQAFTAGYNLVWLELSDNAAFSAAAGAVTRDGQAFQVAQRLNCSPPGFFRAAPTAQSWATVASAAGDGGRVYYRVRQCLASASGPDDPGACVVSATQYAPAFVTLDLPPTPGGCSTRRGTEGGQGERGGWAWFALLPVAAALSRRRARRSGGR